MVSTKQLEIKEPVFYSCNSLVVIGRSRNTYSHATKTTTKKSSEYVGTCCDPESKQIQCFIAIVIIFRIIRRLVNVIDPIVPGYKPTKCEKIEKGITTFVNWVLVIFAVRTIIVVATSSTRTHTRKITDYKNSTSDDKIDWNHVFPWTVIFIFCS